MKKDNPTQFYEYFDVYIFRNDTIIKYLDITEQEQKSLKTIIAKREKYDRKNARRTPRNKAGLTKKQQEKADRKRKIQELKAQGYKQKDVIKLLISSNLFLSCLAIALILSFMSENLSPFNNSITAKSILITSFKSFSRL